MSKPSYSKPGKTMALNALRLAFQGPQELRWRIVGVPAREIESQDVEPREDLIFLMETEPEKVPPIVVEALPKDQYLESYRVLDGHHRLDSLRRAGHEMVWAVEVDRSSA